MDARAGMTERDRVRRGLRKAAARQHGVVRFQQGLTFGRRRAVEDELSSDLWVRRDRGIYLLRGARWNEMAQAWAALLHAGPGVAVSHHSAAALWERPGYRMLPLHTWRRRGANSVRSTAALKVHETRVLPDDHVTHVDGVPVTRPARTVVDLAALVPVPRVAALLDRLWSDRLVTWDELARCLAELDQRGRRGIKVMRALLDARGQDYIPPASALERRAEYILGEHGVTGLERQVRLGGEEFAGRVDLLHPPSDVVLEVQSDRWHTSLVDRAADAARRAHLEALGYVVVEVWESQLFHGPYDWADGVAALIRRRTRRTA